MGVGLLVVPDKEYRLVTQPAHKFFGAQDVDAYGSRVRMAEPEKAVLDCLDRPQHAGDIPEVAAMLWHGKGRLNLVGVGRLWVTLPLPIPGAANRALFVILCCICYDTVRQRNALDVYQRHHR